MTMATSPDAQQRAWFRALDHARLLGVVPTYNIAGDYYHVTSPTSGRYHRMRRYYIGATTHWTCSCPAAYHGQACWARALVMALPIEIARRKEREQEMKLELKLAGAQIKEAGYYPATCNDARVVATGKTEDDGTPQVLLELDCSVTYEDEEIAVTTGQYLTLGPDSKLTQLLIATGYGKDFEAVTERYARDGVDSDGFKGKHFRILYTATTGKNGRPWIKETGYAPLSKKALVNGKAKPAAEDDDVAF